MILKLKDFNNRYNNSYNDIIISEKYPNIRHLSSYQATVSILQNNVLLSRNKLGENLHLIDKELIDARKFNSDDNWWDERKQIELERFGTEDMIFCTADWYNNYGYETGHGPVMIYFKPEIFEDFKVTLTILDSLNESEKRVFNKNEISKIYSNIISNSKNEYIKESNKILNNIENKNKGRYFLTTKGKVFIEDNKFYDKYSEIQIHTDKIPINYIKEIKLTDNYFDVKDSDEKYKKILINLCKEKNIRVKR